MLHNDENDAFLWFNRCFLRILHIKHLKILKLHISNFYAIISPFYRHSLFQGYKMPILAFLSLSFACASTYRPRHRLFAISSMVAIFASFVYFFKNIFYKVKAGRLSISHIVIGGGGQND